MPWVTEFDDGMRRAIAGPDMVLLRTTVPLGGEDFKTVGEFTVVPRETVPFTLTYMPSHLLNFRGREPFRTTARYSTVFGWAGSPKVDFRSMG